MKNKITSVVATLFAMLGMNSGETAVASFEARIDDLVVSDPYPTDLVPRLVAVTTFDYFDLNSATAPVSVTYTIDDNTNDGTPVRIYEGTATISPGQTQVSVGNNATGKIVLTYSPVDQSLKAHLRLNQAYRPSSSGWYIVNVHVNGDVYLNAKSAIYSVVPS